MIVEELRALWRAQPFKPFTIHVADGRVLRVPDPDLLAITPGGGTVIVFRKDDSFAMLEPSHIIELRPRKKGKRKR